MLFSVFIQETCTCSWLLFRCWHVRYFFSFSFLFSNCLCQSCPFLLSWAHFWGKYSFLFEEKLQITGIMKKLSVKGYTIQNTRTSKRPVIRLPWSMIQTTRDVCENNPNFKHFIISKYNFKKLINVNMTEVGTVWMNEGLVVISYH